MKHNTEILQRTRADNLPNHNRDPERSFAILKASATATKAELYNLEAAVCALLGALEFNLSIQLSGPIIR